MLEVLGKIICASIMAITGYYIINVIIQNKNKKANIYNILYILILVIISVILHPIQYAGLYTITIFLLDIIIYKMIFKISLEESILSCGILMLIVSIAELIVSIIVRQFFSIHIIRTDFLISILANLSVGILCCILMNIPFIKDQLRKFYQNIIPMKMISNIIFFTLLIIEISFLFYNMAVTNLFNINYIINLIVIIISFIITYIFIKNKNEYKKLTDEYDTLFNYIQTFEDWIEKEQLNRHEYKNQLAVLRCLTKEKKVKDKIDEILEDNINIEGQAVTQLKSLPKGGIKGLMYYKAALAQKNKLNLTIDVSIESKGILTKLSEKEIRILCKLIGIYFDNAIEAAGESRKKTISIEVYELKDKVNFVFSNTFKRHKNMKDRNKKGVSSKGEGRGNGLYFASKLIKDNSWLAEKQEIIDNYYIQQLFVYKQNKKGS